MGNDGLVKNPLNRTWLKEEYALYNLKDDVGETRNLINQFPERTVAMKQRYTEWRASMSDRSVVIETRILSVILRRLDASIDDLDSTRSKVAINWRYHGLFRFD